MTIKLFCLEKGQTPAVQCAFEVEVGRDESISALKDAIKAKNAVDFAHVDAKNLKLWMVNISANQDELLQQHPTRNSIELLPIKRPATIFPTTMSLSMSKTHSRFTTSA